MNQKLAVIIMAGGKGTRLQPLTANTPKCLVEIANKPILEYVLENIYSAGMQSVYLSVNHLKDKIKSYLKSSNQQAVLKFIEEKEFHGTIGSIAEFDFSKFEHVLIMNSDLITNIDINKFYEFHLKSEGEMTVATLNYTIEIPYGIIESSNSKIVSIREKPTKSYCSNAGIYILNSNLISEIPKNKRYNATDLIQKLLNENRTIIQYPIKNNYWFDIGTLEDLKKARNFITKK